MSLRPLTRCHHPNLDSIDLGPRLRCFVARGALPALQLGRREPFPVCAHQHRYPIVMHRLSGRVENIFFDPVPTGHPFKTPMHLIEVDTPLADGSFRVTEGPILSDVGVRSEPLQRAELTASVFHTVVCSAGARWLVLEGEPRDIKPLCMSPIPEISDYVDLYQPMPERQADALRREIAASVPADWIQHLYPRLQSLLLAELRGAHP